jgi:hypothetical protein
MEETVKKLVEQKAQINSKLELLCGLIPKVEEMDTPRYSLGCPKMQLSVKMLHRGTPRLSS